ncbi:SRPBCC family protein [Skermanella pratensis]|uniref:SRPBCC family protein n=1 Tax=Skermanella pratensis TaxID=2233999 RepID=UPI0013016D61|nr:SRPBCC family protein [Skermanella pratensis]
MTAAEQTTTETIPDGMGTVVEPGAIRFERLLPGPIERVWAYLTESEKRGQWLASGEMEPRAGSAFSLHFDNSGLSPQRVPTPERFRRYDTGITTSHEVTRCEPPHVLAFTWGGGTEEPSEVTFELAREGEGVRLVLTHRRLPDAPSLTNVGAGWHSHLAILADKLSGRTPPSFWTLFDKLEAVYA